MSNPSGNTVTLTGWDLQKETFSTNFVLVDFLSTAKLTALTIDQLTMTQISVTDITLYSIKGTISSDLTIQTVTLTESTATDASSAGIIFDIAGS